MFTCKTAGPVRVGTALTGVVQPMINSVQIYGEKVGYFTLVSFLQNSPTLKDSLANKRLLVAFTRGC